MKLRLVSLKYNQKDEAFAGILLFPTVFIFVSQFSVRPTILMFDDFANEILVIDRNKIMHLSC